MLLPKIQEDLLKFIAGSKLLDFYDYDYDYGSDYDMIQARYAKAYVTKFLTALI